MKALLLKCWDRLRSSFWFVPASMACLAVAMAGVAVELDNAIASDWLLKLGWSYSVVATFVYFLLVLRTIRRVDEVAFVPHLAVSIGVLIYFIHRVSVSIQADEVVGQVGRELGRTPP